MDDTSPSHRDAGGRAPEQTPSSDAPRAVKKARRRAAWAVRRGAARDDAARAALDEAVAAHGVELVRSLTPPPALVCTYESWPVEPPTGRLNAALAEAGYELLVPITRPDLDLDWRPVDSPDEPESAIDRSALAEVALVLAPATLVDRSGTRLGQGGGCYDRTLPRLAAGTPVVAVLFDDELVDEPLPREPHDATVDLVLQPRGVTRLG